MNGFQIGGDGVGDTVGQVVGSRQNDRDLVRPLFVIRNGQDFRQLAQNLCRSPPIKTVVVLQCIQNFILERQKREKHPQRR
jgi:RNA-binding protein YhbY